MCTVFVFDFYTQSSTFSLPKSVSYLLKFVNFFNIEADHIFETSERYRFWRNRVFTNTKTLIIWYETCLVLETVRILDG